MAMARTMPAGTLTARNSNPTDPLNGRQEETRETTFGAFDRYFSEVPDNMTTADFDSRPFRQETVRESTRDIYEGTLRASRFSTDADTGPNATEFTAPVRSFSFANLMSRDFTSGLSGGFEPAFTFLNPGLQNASLIPLNIWIDWYGDNSYQGTGGNDLAYGLGGDDNIVLATGNDIAYGGDGHDYVHAGIGDDLVYGGTGDDTVAGDIGNDTIDGGTGNDRISAGDDNDLIYGGDGEDTLDGGDDNDSIWAGNDADTVRGGEGDDFVDAGAGADQVHGEGGNDEIIGGFGNDFLFGNEGNDTIFGGEGNDYLIGHEGIDFLYGENGNDWMSGGDHLDLLVGGDGSDTMDGGAANDIMWGDAGTDFMFGGHGNDFIHGGNDADHITGGANGSGTIGDQLTGGGGSDLFYFLAGESGGISTAVDVINDFAQGSDLLVLQGFQGDFLGQQNGFSDAPGAQVWFEHTFRDDIGPGTAVTNVHARDNNGLETDLTFSLLGHHALVEGDFFLI